MATADAGKAVMKLVRLHLRRDGEIVDTSEDFELGEFADSLPAPGDKIVLPWARDGGSRTDPENRAVHEVEERYFLPNAYGRDSRQSRGHSHQSYRPRGCACRERAIGRRLGTPLLW